MVSRVVVTRGSKIQRTRKESIRTRFERTRRPFSETINNLIASWEALTQKPVPRIMAEATPASDESVSEVVEVSESPKQVVANYLNGEMVETRHHFTHESISIL